MTDLEFFASNQDTVYRLRAAFEGEASEGTLIAVYRADCELLRRIAPTECEITSNERLAKWAFDDGFDKFEAIEIGSTYAF